MTVRNLQKGVIMASPSVDPKVPFMPPPGPGGAGTSGVYGTSPGSDVNAPAVTAPAPSLDQLIKDANLTDTQKAQVQLITDEITRQSELYQKALADFPQLPPPDPVAKAAQDREYQALVARSVQLLALTASLLATLESMSGEPTAEAAGQPVASGALHDETASYYVLATGNEPPSTSDVDASGDEIPPPVVPPPLPHEASRVNYWMGSQPLANIYRALQELAKAQSQMTQQETEIFRTQVKLRSEAADDIAQSYTDEGQAKKEMYEKKAVAGLVCTVAAASAGLASLAYKGGATDAAIDINKAKREAMQSTSRAAESLGKSVSDFIDMGYATQLAGYEATRAVRQNQQQAVGQCADTAMQNMNAMRDFLTQLLQSASHISQSISESIRFSSR